jgi:hypothetical protein
MARVKTEFAEDINKRDLSWDSDPQYAKFLRDKARESIVAEPTTAKEDTQSNVIKFLLEENKIMKSALESIIDYHHVVGNRDVSVSHNEFAVKNYRLAQAGLEDAARVRATNVHPVFTDILSGIKKICEDYNEKLLWQRK